jgi:hypothetical protein
MDNICNFLENFKQKYPDFVVEALSNDLESAYIEIFSNIDDFQDPTPAEYFELLNETNVKGTLINHFRPKSCNTESL